MPEIHHFYHLGASGAWEIPAAEHACALRRASLPGRATVGITGSGAECDQARRWLGREWPAAKAVTGTGYEQFTLRLAAAWAAAHPDGLMLYAHTKGASSPSPLTRAWRESMTIDVVEGWRRCVAKLADHDVAGPHWLTPEAFPAMPSAPQEQGGSPHAYFGGNFWWATAKYLAGLPPVSDATRWDAERWIGLGQPKAYDLRPGWPRLEIFARR